MIDQAQLQAHLLDAYAAGQLGPGMRLLVETQAAMRPAQDLAVADTLGGALLERETPAAMAADALEQVLAKIDVTAPAGGRGHGRWGAEVEKLPEPLRFRALEELGKHGWRYAGPGVRILQLRALGGPTTELIRIEPGFGVPNHTHTAGEYTLVLTGAFADERGRYAAGDIGYADPSVTHTPRAEKGEVCYNLAVSEAPLVLTGPLGLIQRLLPN